MIVIATAVVALSMIFRYVLKRLPGFWRNPFFTGFMVGVVYSVVIWGYS